MSGKTNDHDSKNGRNCSFCICVSYDRCLDICSKIAVSMLVNFVNDGVFTGNFRKNLFTIIAKDNIDVNSKSTKVGQYYHEISMAIMQFLSNENCNGLQQTLYDQLTNFSPMSHFYNP